MPAMPTRRVNRFSSCHGKVVRCDGCGAELEIVWLDPIGLDLPVIDDDSDESADF